MVPMPVFLLGISVYSASQTFLVIVLQSQLVDSIYYSVTASAATALAFAILRINLA